MIRIAVVDDAPEDAGRLMGYLQRYQAEEAQPLQARCYHASLDFLEEFQGQYEVVFLDIEMPGSTGLEAAEEIRRRDTSVGIVFITHMAQYAVHGYRVNAIDFMVKPVSYYLFSETLKKALRFARKREKRSLLLSNEDGIYRIAASDLFYVEKVRDNLHFHTNQGVFVQRGSIKGLKETLAGLPFAENTAGSLVNLEMVRRVGKESISVRDVELPLSRRMKKQFTQEYISYVGGGF